MERQAIYINKTNPNSTYVKVGFAFKGYKTFHLHGYVDTGSSICVASKNIIPPELWIDIDQPIKVNIANNSSIIISRVARDTNIFIEGEKFKVPTIFQQESGMDFIIGNSFCRTYHPFIQDLDFVSFTKLNGQTVKTKIIHYALKIANEGFINSLKRRKRGDLYHRKRIFQPVNIAVQIDSKESLSESIELDEELCTDEQTFINELTWHSEIMELLKKASAESPLSDKNTSTERADIKLKDPDKVIRVKGIAYTPDNAIEINKQIQELLDLKVIKKSRSPHSSPCFLVNNHNEIKRGKKRLVINYKALNNATIDDGYLLPNKDSILSAIRGKSHFTGLDCKSGFWQIRLTEQSKPLTAFSCPMGQYEWNVMPFGLKQAPGIFQRYMDSVFEKHKEYIRVYVDDILIFSEDEKSHYQHVKLALEECISHGIILSEKKAEINKSKINYLGLEVERGRINLQPHILEKIHQFPDHIPDKVTLQRFLGCLTYAQNYIKNLSEIRKPLQAKLKKDVPWYWTPVDTAYMRKVKNKVVNLPALHLPEVNEKLIIETDASNTYWGGILKSKNKDGVEELCGYTSGSFAGSEINYHSNEKEILAVKRVISKFRLYLASNQFLVRTDNKNVKAFMNIKVQNDYKQGRLIRWQQWFSHYKFDVEYIEGRHNSLADSLTRELAFTA